MSTGRNDPCRCGSGKKYKHCCLAVATASVTAEPVAIAAQRKAHDWLSARFGKAKSQDITDEFFNLVADFPPPEDADDHDDPINAFLDGLDEGGHYTLSIGLHDWALHETDYQRYGETALGIEWVLRAGDLRLSAAQRAFLQATAASHLHVYEVSAVEPERGLHLRDVLQPDEPARFVREVAATGGLIAGHLIGARVIEHDGAHELGGALYPLSTIGVLEILDETAGMFEREECEPRRIPAWLIRDSWLLDRLRSPLSRTLPRSRPPYLEDRYDVIDVDALHGLLDGDEAIVNLGKRNSIWIREALDSDESDPEDTIVLQHPLAADGKSDTTILLNRSPDETRGDASHAWLESLAGSVLRHRERERLEPADEDDFRLPLPLGYAGPATIEDRHTELLAQYANWCDEPLAILGAQSPRNMLADSADRYRVELLLRLYDDVERAYGSVVQRPAVTFDFLRAQLGLVNRTGDPSV